MAERRTPAELTSEELLADLIGYHAGRATNIHDASAPARCGYYPLEWAQDTVGWLRTPRGREAIGRLVESPRARRVAVWATAGVGFVGFLLGVLVMAAIRG